MALDPSIILSGQTPQFANPLDMAVKGMILKNLAQESQVRGQGIADDQATRDAYATNTNPDGSLNKQGTLSSLRTAGLGGKADDLQTQWAARDAATVAQHSAMTLKLLGSIPTDKDTPPAVKEAAWQSATKIAAQNNLPVAQQMQQFPGYPGDSMAQHMQFIAQNYEQQQAAKNKAAEIANSTMTAQAAQTKAAADTAEVQNKKQQMALDSQKFGIAQKDKQNENQQQALQLIDSGRQDPSVIQSDKDILASKKLKMIIGPDPNKTSTTQAQLAAMEIVKLASGGIPSTEELKGVLPIDKNSIVASTAQAYLSHPTPSGQGAFLKEYLSYANDISNNARQLVGDKVSRIIESKRNAMGEDNYNTLKTQYLNNYDDVLYAEKHGMTIDQVQKLKELRGAK